MDKQTQYYDVVPYGMIQGGNAAYTADLITGKISYEAHVVVKMMFFKQTKNFSGKYQIDPKVLLSQNLAQVGDSQNVAGVTFEVTSVSPGHVDVAVSHPQFKGTAVLETSRTYLKLVSLDSIANVMGRDIKILLEEEANLLT